MYASPHTSVSGFLLGIFFLGEGIYNCANFYCYENFHIVFHLSLGEATEEINQENSIICKFWHAVNLIVNHSDDYVNS